MIDIVKSNRRPIVIFLMGPTASGKTALALALKQRLPIEIVSVDSLLIYRGMDIGTAKPVIEELKLAPHRLINIRDPSESYSAADFFYDAIFEISDIINNGNIPLLVGGTMLYFKLLLHGLSPVPPASCLVREQIKQEADIIGWEVLYKRLQEIDPVSAAKIHLNDKRRLIRALEIFLISGKTLTELIKVSLKPLSNYQVCQFAILPNNCGVLDKRIVSRFYHMLDIGFESEVRSLYARRDLHDTMSSICSVGYRQMWSYLSGTISYDDMIFNTICATRHLAKRQITWLRGWGHCINWLGNVTIFSNIDKIMQIISPILH